MEYGTEEEMDSKAVREKLLARLIDDLDMFPDSDDGGDVKPDGTHIEVAASGDGASDVGHDLIAALKNKIGKEDEVV